jgi:carbamoyl-phosphate synthase large subunit
VVKSARVRILVTGIDGDSGQSLVKALRLSVMPVELHGCDSAGGGLGSTFVRSCHSVPPASDRAAYVGRLDEICRRYRMDAVVPATPSEIDVLCRLGDPPRLPSGAPVVCLPASYRDVFDDKLRCYRALEGHVALAPFADGSDLPAVYRLVEQFGYPLVVKRRRGRGGDSFAGIRGEEDLLMALSRTPDPVVQGYIDEARGEHTIGVFASESAVTAIAFRRRLGRTGSSWSAQTLDDPEVLAYAEQVARVSGLRGAANIQVRQSEAGVRLLEVNARFSSLAPARAYAGFRDVEWSVAVSLGRAPDIPADGYRRIRFQRFVHEMVDVGDGFAPVAEWSRWKRPRTAG